MEKGKRPKISKNVMVMNEYNDLVFYRAQCGCMHDRHVQTLSLSRAEESGIHLCIDAELHLRDRYDVGRGRFARAWFRVKSALKILFLGTISLEEEFIFNDEDSIRNYIVALEEGIDKLKASETSAPVV